MKRNPHAKELADRKYHQRVVQQTAKQKMLKQLAEDSQEEIDQWEERNHQQELRERWND